MCFKEVLPNIFIGTIEEKRVSQASSNVYIIKDNDQGLLIDCGYDGEISRNFITNGLAYLGIDVQKLKILITHSHVDHIGSIEYWLSQGATLLMSEMELLAAIKNKRIDWARAVLYGINKFEYNHILTDSEKKIIPQDFFTENTPYTKLSANDKITIGEYNFTVQLYSGHSDAQTCLWEEQKNFMFCGDQVLLSGCPTINAWSLPNGYLKAFFDSLQSIKQLDCSILLPGHGPILRSDDDSINLAINSNRQEYNRLIERLLDILQTAEEPHTVIEIVSRLYGNSWHDYFSGHLRRKSVMTNKVYACLTHLVETSIIKCTQSDGTVYYSL